MLRNFEIYTEFENKTLGLPMSRELLLGNGNYCTVTSSKKICLFTLSQYCMKLYEKKTLSDEEILFNCCVSRKDTSLRMHLQYRLTLSWRRPLSYRNQSIDLKSKSMNWFLYDNSLCHERIKRFRIFLSRTTLTSVKIRWLQIATLALRKLLG